MILNLFDWFTNLQGFELILWCIALLFSLLFVIQTVISFITGGDGDLDGDGFAADAGDGYQFFTIKNMIAFFTMFGWASLAAYKGGLGNGLSVVIGLLAGTGMVGLMYAVMRNTARLRNNGTLQLKNAVNVIGETYLRIPGDRGGMGKIHIQVQGRLMELDAMTDDAQDIATGRPVRVLSQLNSSILMVTAKL
ncbi:MAG TPA: hypothetical protein VHK69_04670 [Chitinophagaceae bacterium]|jgi:hypothetical protein|nr:hypothetical protein [Chitinophagaceae bacterium]